MISHELRFAKLAPGAGVQAQGGAASPECEDCALRFAKLAPGAGFGARKGRWWVQGLLGQLPRFFGRKMPHAVAVHGRVAKLLQELVVGHGPHGGPDNG